MLLRVFGLHVRRSNTFRPFSHGFLGGFRRAQEGPGSPYKLPAPGNAHAFGWRFQVLAVQLRLLRTMTDASESKRGQRAAECHDKAADMDSQVRVATLAALRRGRAAPQRGQGSPQRAIEALANLGVAVGLLCDKDAAVRRCACEALPKLGQAAAPHAAAMAELLRDDNFVVREAAIRALANLGVAAAPHAVAMAELLCDKNPNVRRRAT